MRFAKIITLIGIALLVFSWVSATFIPTQARNDFHRLVRDSGGLSTPGDYVGMYQQMCASRRMLQNFYVGAAGLVCLCIGLARWTKQVEQAASANGGPTVASGHSGVREGPP